MKKRNYEFGDYMKRLYFLAGILLVILVAVIHISWGDKVFDIGLGKAQDISDEWTRADGTMFNLEKNKEYRQDGMDATLYYQIPDTIGEGKALVFISKDAVIRACVDGEVVYETYQSDRGLYNMSTGVIWNIIELDSAYAGKTLTLEIDLVYHSGKPKIDNTYIGDPAAITLRIMQNSWLSIIVSIFIFAVGVFTIAVNFVFNNSRKVKDNSLLYLGGFAVMISAWCLIETQIFSLIVKDVMILQVVDNMLLTMSTMPLFIYMNESFHLFRMKTARVVAILDLIYIFVTIILHVSHIADFHLMLPFAFVFSGIASLLLIICVIQEQQPFRHGYIRNRYDTMKQIGIAILAVSLSVDLLRYLILNDIDRAVFLRFGLLIFICFFAAGNMASATQLIQQGMKAEIISDLAYIDDLTGTSNRNAYNESVKYVNRHVQQTGEPLQVCVIMLDVNELKYVNDTRGHQAGNDLLIRASQAIKETYENSRFVYRVGGDEFIVLFIGEKAVTAFQEKIEKFYESCKKYDVSIAIGSYCGHVKDEADFERIEHLADQAMYENKVAYKKKNGIKGRKTVQI